MDLSIVPFHRVVLEAADSDISYYANRLCRGHGLPMFLRASPFGAGALLQETPLPLSGCWPKGHFGEAKDASLRSFKRFQP